MDSDKCELSAYMLNNTVSEQSPMRPDYLTFYKSRRSISGQRMLRTPADLEVYPIVDNEFARKRHGSKAHRLVPRVSGSDLCLDDFRKQTGRNMTTTFFDSSQEGRNMDFACEAIGSGKSLFASRGLTSFGGNDTFLEQADHISFDKSHGYGSSSLDIWNKHKRNDRVSGIEGTDGEALKSSVHFELFGGKKSIGECSGINEKLPTRKLFFMQEYPKRANNNEDKQDIGTAGCNKRRSYIDKARSIFGLNHTIGERDHAELPDKCCGNVDSITKSMIEPDNEIYASYISDHCRKNRRGRNSGKTAGVVSQGRQDFDRDVGDPKTEGETKQIFSFNARDVPELPIASRYSRSGARNERRYESRGLSYFTTTEGSEQISNLTAESKVERERIIHENASTILKKRNRRHCVGSKDNSHELQGGDMSNKSHLPSKRRTSKRRHKTPPKDTPCYIQGTYNKGHTAGLGKNKQKLGLSLNEKQENALNRSENEHPLRRSFFSARRKLVIPETPNELIFDNVLAGPPWTCTKWVTDVSKEANPSQWAYEVYSDTCLRCPAEDQATLVSNKTCVDTADNFKVQETANKYLQEVSRKCTDSWKGVLFAKSLGDDGPERPRKLINCDTSVAAAQGIGMRPCLVTCNNPVNSSEAEYKISNHKKDMRTMYKATGRNDKQKNSHEFKAVNNSHENRRNIQTNNREDIKCVREIKSNIRNYIDAHRNTSKLQAADPQDCIRSEEMHNKMSQSEQTICSVAKNEESSRSETSHPDIKVNDGLMTTVHAIKEDIQSVFERLSSLEKHQDRRILKTALSLKEDVLSVLDQAKTAEISNIATKATGAAEVVKTAFKKIAKFSTAFAAERVDDDDYNRVSYELYKTGKEEYNAEIEAKGHDYDINVLPIDTIRPTNKYLNETNLNKFENARQMTESGCNQTQAGPFGVASDETDRMNKRLDTSMLFNDKEQIDERKQFQQKNRALSHHIMKQVDDESVNDSRRLMKLMISEDMLFTSNTDPQMNDRSSKELCMQQYQEKLSKIVSDIQESEGTHLPKPDTSEASNVSLVLKKKKTRKLNDTENFPEISCYSEMLDANLERNPLQTSTGKHRLKLHRHSDLDMFSVDNGGDECSSVDQNTNITLNENAHPSGKVMCQAYPNRESKNLATGMVSEKSPETEVSSYILFSYSPGITMDQSSSIASSILREDRQHNRTSSSDSRGDDEAGRLPEVSEPMMVRESVKSRRRSSQYPITTRDVKIVYKIKSKTSMSESETSIINAIMLQETEEETIAIPVPIDIADAIAATKLRKCLDFSNTGSKVGPDNGYKEQLYFDKYECDRNISETNGNPDNEVQKSCMPQVEAESTPVTAPLKASQQGRETEAKLDSNTGNSKKVKVGSLSSSETSVDKKSNLTIRRKIKKRKAVRRASKMFGSERGNLMLQDSDRKYSVKSKDATVKTSKKPAQWPRNTSTTDTQSDDVSKCSRDINNKLNHAVLSVDNNAKVEVNQEGAKRSMLLNTDHENETLNVESNNRVKESKDLIDSVSTSQLNTSIMKLYEEINKLRMKLETSDDETSSQSLSPIRRLLSCIKLNDKKRKALSNELSPKSRTSSNSSSRQSLISHEKASTARTKTIYYGPVSHAFTRDKHATKSTKCEAKQCCAYQKYGTSKCDSSPAYYQERKEVSRKQTPAPEEPELPAPSIPMMYEKYIEKKIPLNLSHLPATNQMGGAGQEYWSECKKGVIDIAELYHDTVYQQGETLEASDDDTCDSSQTIERRLETHLPNTCPASELASSGELPIFSELDLLYTNNAVPDVESMKGELQIKSPSQSKFRLNGISASCETETTACSLIESKNANSMFKCQIEPLEPDIWSNRLIYSTSALLSQKDSTYTTEKTTPEASNQVTHNDYNLVGFDRKKECSLDKSVCSKSSNMSAFDKYGQRNGQLSSTDNEDLYFDINSKMNQKPTETLWSNSFSCCLNEELYTPQTKRKDASPPGKRTNPENVHFNRGGMAMGSDSEESPVKQQGDYIPQGHMPRIVQRVKDMLFGSTKALSKIIAFENPPRHACPPSPRPTQRRRSSSSPNVNTSHTRVDVSAANENDNPAEEFVNARRGLTDNSKHGDDRSDESDVVTSPMLNHYIVKRRDVHDTPSTHSSHDESQNTSRLVATFESQEINEASPCYSEDFWTGSVTSSCSLREQDLIRTSQSSQRHYSPQSESESCTSNLKYVAETDKTVRHYCDAINGNGNKRMPAHETCLVSISNVCTSSMPRSETSFRSDRGYSSKQDDAKRQSCTIRSSNLPATDLKEENNIYKTSSNSPGYCPEWKSQVKTSQDGGVSARENIIVSSFEGMIQQRGACYVEDCGFRQKKGDTMLLADCDIGEMNKEDEAENSGQSGTKNGGSVETIANGNNSIYVIKRAETIGNDNNSSYIIKRAETIGNDNNSSYVIKRAETIASAHARAHANAGFVKNSNDFGDGGVFGLENECCTRGRWLKNIKVSESGMHKVYISKGAEYSKDETVKDDEDVVNVEEATRIKEDKSDETQGEESESNAKKMVVEADERAETFSDDESNKQDESHMNTTFDEDEQESWYKTTDDESSVW